MIVWEKINFKLIFNNDFIFIIDMLFIGFRVMNLFIFNILIFELYFVLILIFCLILFILMFRFVDCMLFLKKLIVIKYVDFEWLMLFLEFFFDVLI